MTELGPPGRNPAEDASRSPALITLSPRQAALVDVLLILGVVALAIVVIGMVGSIFFAFGDIILTFFLAWLIAFILNPVVRRIVLLRPRIPRVVAVAVVYLALIAGFLAIIVIVAQSLVVSISDFITSLPKLDQDLPAILKPVQDWLATLGFGQVDIVAAARQLLERIGQSAAQIVGPLQSIAVASFGALGTMLIVVILSVYIVIDQDSIQSFVIRIIPPGRRDAVRLLERAVSDSFGGFLRGQAIIGITYGLVALGASAVLGLPFIGVTSAAAGILMAIPFFGPFVAWAPPVVAAVFGDPSKILPTLAIMGIGWFIVMNILQPRLMSNAVGLHPVVVLASVLIGGKIAGVAGAIFGIPIAAVISSLFLYYFALFGGEPSITERAARLIQERESRAVRVPREPTPGVDAELDEVASRPPVQSEGAAPADRSS